MTTFALIPGGGCDASYWRDLAGELAARGHEGVPVNLPCDDDSAGLAEYADTVVQAVGDRSDLAVVAHSLGGFTATLACDRLPVRLLVLLTAMVPRPGEKAGDWWDNTGYGPAHRAAANQMGFDPDDFDGLFYNDVPAEKVAEVVERDQSGTPMEQPWPLPALPDVPTTFLLCRDDWFFPADFMRAMVADRLGSTPDEIDGGHMVMMSRPAELADRLVSYL